MNVKELLNLTISGVTTPQDLWNKKLQENKTWADMLKFPVLPFVVIVALVSAVLILVFGYKIPFVGVVKPSVADALLQAVGTVIMYGITIVIMSWVAAYLAGMTEGTNDQNRAMLMLFLVSIPSLLGQVLGTLPMVGMIIAIGLGIYSIVLAYKAIPVFMKVPLEKRVRYYVLLAISSMVVAVVMNLTVGKIFAPSVQEFSGIEMNNFELQK